jgi:hypothetical protein
MQIFIEEVNVPINCFNYGQSLPKEQHLCHFHVRASLVSFNELPLTLVLRTNINVNKDAEKALA